MRWWLSTPHQISYHHRGHLTRNLEKKLGKTLSNQGFPFHIASFFQSSQRLTSISSSSPVTYQTRTFLTQLRRQAQALKEQIPSTPTIPSTTKASKPAPTLKLTNLPYFVRRTGSNQLPVYVVTKAGGTKQLTKIQKTEGDLDTLRTDLAHSLGVDPRSPDVSINRLTGHIIVKVLPPPSAMPSYLIDIAIGTSSSRTNISLLLQGWRKPEIVKFLSERNF
jgi:large subunit ribosomal protein L49